MAPSEWNGIFDCRIDFAKGQFDAKGLEICSNSFIALGW